MSIDESMITELTAKNKQLSIENFNLQNQLNEYEQQMQQSYSKDKAQLLYKIQRAKQKLNNMHIKKTGKNKFSNYDYYELEDINKPICDALIEEGLASLFTFKNKQGFLRIVDSETGAYECWCTETNTSMRYQKSLKDTKKKGNVGDVMQTNQALQTYARRALYLQALEIAEPNIIENDGINKRKQDTTMGDMKIPENTSPEVKEVFERIQKDFANKVPFNKTTIKNKLRSMIEHQTIDEDCYERCVEVINDIKD